MIWQTIDNFLTRIRPQRQVLALGLDGLTIVLCWNITYLFRLGFERWAHERPSYDHWVILSLTALYLLIFALLGIPKSIWRFSGFGEIKRIALGCVLAGLIGAVAVLMAQITLVPRAVLALHPVVCLMGLCSTRIGYRMLYEHLRKSINGKSDDNRRALVLGAGTAARMLLAGIQHQGWVVVGLLDDDPNKSNGRVNGLPVLGNLESVAQWSEMHGVTHLIVAMPSATPAQRRRALDLAAATHLPVMTVPNPQELRDGRVVTQVRDIQPEDLLGREPVVLDEAGISECINGKVVLVTGAGGSIGSELCRQIAKYGPSKIVLYELSEFNLYTIEQELTERFPHIPLVRLMGDVKDLEHLRFTFGRFKPQIVFHAAAFKHVPLMEEENAWAALRNNTLGTYNATQAAAENGAERFVLISTDKAVNPTNVMGATKRAAELVISHMAGQGHATKFMAVRFGNVLGSSGSVIPKFKEQIAKGGPVTVTHPDITRYFMTIPEAARLVVQAAAIGESGQVLVLDMGEPVRIVDLARDMIRLSGRSLHEIKIECSGLRPGEKLFEELFADSDTTLPTTCPELRIFQLDDRVAAKRVVPWLFESCELVADKDVSVRSLLMGLLREFRQPDSDCP